MDCSLPGSSIHGFSGQEYWSGLTFPSQGIFLTQGLNSGLPYRGQTLYHLSHQGISHQLHALHIAHQQIGPGLQGSVLAWAAEDIHEVNGPKTRHPSPAAVPHLSLQGLMRLSRKRKEPWPRLNFPLIYIPKYNTKIYDCDKLEKECQLPEINWMWKRVSIEEKGSKRSKARIFRSTDFK